MWTRDVCVCVCVFGGSFDTAELSEVPLVYQVHVMPIRMARITLVRVEQSIR